MARPSRPSPGRDAAARPHGLAADPPVQDHRPQDRALGLHRLGSKSFRLEAELVVDDAPTAKVAQRAGTMARKVNLDIAGVIENMSAFVAPDGERYELFLRLRGEDGLSTLHNVLAAISERIAYDTDATLAGTTAAHAFAAGHSLRLAVSTTSTVSSMHSSNAWTRDIDGSSSSPAPSHRA
mgnify:CR=1 FL=1